MLHQDTQAVSTNVRIRKWAEFLTQPPEPREVGREGAAVGQDRRCDGGKPESGLTLRSPSTQSHLKQRKNQADE